MDGDEIRKEVRARKEMESMLQYFDVGYSFINQIFEIWQLIKRLEETKT